MKITVLKFLFVMSWVAGLHSTHIFAESKSNIQEERGSLNRMELETLTIQGNKELPKVLFVVPWQEVKHKKGGKDEPGLVLHSLYGDLFDPISPTGNLKINH